MKILYTGTVHLFGKNIDTDQIYPGQYLELVEPDDIGKHCLEGADPDFSARVKPGDIVIAGTNFGCGSSREHAGNSSYKLREQHGYSRVFLQEFFTEMR